MFNNLSEKFSSGYNSKLSGYLFLSFAVVKLVCGSQGNIFLDVVVADAISLVTVFSAVASGHSQTYGCGVVLGEGLWIHIDYFL